MTNQTSASPATISPPTFDLGALVVEPAMPTFSAPKSTTKKESDGVNPNWFIDTTPLGCGLLTFVGWSGGLGIDETSNKLNFERDMFKLLFWSRKANPTGHAYVWPENYPGDRGNLHTPLKEKPEDPTFRKVHIMRANRKFLSPLHTVLLSSKVEWIERFAKFVKDHDLGDFSVSHVFRNKYWRNNELLNATWTWNMNVPDHKKCGIETWEY